MTSPPKLRKKLKLELEQKFYTAGGRPELEQGFWESPGCATWGQLRNAGIYIWEQREDGGSVRIGAGQRQRKREQRGIF